MIEKNFDTLYTLDSKGKVRVFECQVLYTANSVPTISTSTGLLGGKMITKLEPVKKGKNIGKANETDTLAQAFLQADSLWRDKWNEGYKSAPVILIRASLLAEKGIIESAIGESIEITLKKIPNASQTNGDWEYLPMLATKLRDIKNPKFPFYCQPKLNGVRCMARFDRDRQVVKLISRGGTYYQIPHIGYELDIMFRHIDPSHNLLLDGELYKHGISLQDISGAARKEETGMFASNSWLEYHIYDVIDLSKLDQTEKDREVNRLSIGITVSQKNLKHLNVLRSLKVLDGTEIEECHDQFLEEGYEGAILRAIDNPYEFNQRSKGLIKVKKFQDEEFEIIGYSVGEGNKSIGESFVFILKNNLLGSTNTFEARPTGTMAQKEYWQALMADIVGKKATVRFQERSKDGLPIQGHVRSELTEVLHIRPNDE